MNIFFLDTNPTKCAQYHVDKHVRKMIVESAQLLATAHRVLDGRKAYFMLGTKKKLFYLLPDEVVFKVIVKGKPKLKIGKPVIYNATHMNHPSAKWVRESKDNYQWLFELLKALLTEFEYRFGKQHKTQETLNFLSQSPVHIPREGLTPMAMAMDDEFKISSDPVVNYQNYYRHGKTHLHDWTNCPAPHFI